MKAGWLFLSIYVFSVSLYAQIDKDTVYPQIGKLCPQFILHNIKYFAKNEASLNDFRGKWLVLDFWNKACGACVVSFPKTSALQREFKDSVSFMLVGIEDREKQIQPMYEKFKKRENLVMPYAFDSTLANRWDIFTAPYIIVIDPNGIVQAITYSINAADIRGFLDGPPPHLPKAYRVHEEEIGNRTPYDASRPLLINNNGGNDSSFIFRSIFSPFNAFEQRIYFPDSITENVANGMFQILGASLYSLYNYAYYGKLKPDSGYRISPVLEVRDSSVFECSFKYSKNLFCYSLMIPPATANKEHMKEIMQQDLKNCFGYLASIEKRKFPCWRIIANDKARRNLKTKGGQEMFHFIIPKADFIAKNWPFNKFVKLIRVSSGSDIIDDTGIVDNVDMSMNSLLTDINDVRKGLQVYGLDIVPSERVMDVMVIRDKP